MELEELSQFRPASKTAADFESTRAKIGAKLDAVRLAVERARERRRTALLSEGAAAVRQAEADIAAGELDQEQLMALAEEINRLLPEMKITEAAAEWDARFASLRAKVAGINYFAKVLYPDASAAIVAGLTEMRDFNAAWFRLREAYEREIPAAVKSKMNLADISLDFVVTHRSGLFNNLVDGVRLPAVRPSGVQVDETELLKSYWNGSEPILKKLRS